MTRETSLPEQLRELAEDGELLWNVARLAIEDELVEWRDACMFVPRRNGFAIAEKDGTPSQIIRFGPEVGVRIALRALADHLDASPSPTPPQSEEAETSGCPTPCDDDCEADCHEWHSVPFKRAHNPLECPGASNAIRAALAQHDAEVRREASEQAWERGVAEERFHQKEVMQYAHWSSISARPPQPLVNPYRAEQREVDWRAVAEYYNEQMGLPRAAFLCKDSDRCAACGHYRPCQTHTHGPCNCSILAASPAADTASGGAL